MVFGALLKRKLAGGGKLGGAYVMVPSLMAIHSNLPTLNLYASLFMIYPSYCDGIIPIGKSNLAWLDF